VHGALIATWDNGLFELDGSATQEFAGRSVGAITRSRSGRILAIVDRRSLVERSGAGRWREIASSVHPLSCVMDTETDVLVGTDDAAVLILNAAGELEPLDGFANAEGRADWYAGTAVIDGIEVGPPLGVRSMSATSDESAWLVNVHVGGIARSADHGASFSSTIDIHCDVHEVSAHPDRASDAIAAAAAGLCVSTDGGRSWRVETDGLHATYCSAVAYCEDALLVAASEHHFSPEGALYRRADGADGPLERVSGGLPEWLDGIVDTACIGTLGSTIAIADRGGHIYQSGDCGASWTLRADGFGAPSAVVVL
jgi:hypothetical protein